MNEVPGYDIGELIGSGGFGSTYKASELSGLRREVALKLIAVEGDDDETQRLLTRELDALGRLSRAGSHPNIVNAFAGGILADGRVWLAMEYCPGGSVADRMKAGDLQPDEVVAIGAKVAAALQHSHAAGVIHRDVKPGNILFNARGEPVLADFGIASLATGLEGTQTVGGVSRGYAAPEQISDNLGRVGPATDCYGLAATLYAALTRRAPVPTKTGEGIAQYFDRVVRETPEPLQVAGVAHRATAAIMEALAKRPDDRPSVSYLQVALGEPVEATEVRTVLRPRAPLPEAPAAEQPMSTGVNRPLIALSQVLAVLTGLVWLVVGFAQDSVAAIWVAIVVMVGTVCWLVVSSRLSR